MVAFSGVSHVGFSVTDLDRSERFYTDVFDLIRVMDVGYGRILLHRQTGFMFAIATHEGAQGSPFTELATGLDHLAFSAEAGTSWSHGSRNWTHSASPTPRSGTWSSATT